MRKYLNVDVIAFLEEKMDSHTEHYKSDFDLDKELIARSATSKRKEDKTLLWLARTMGTHCFKEREAFIRDTSAHTTARYYAEQTKGDVLACAIEIIGVQDGVVRGNVYELDYAVLAEEVERRSVQPLDVEKVFEDGFVDRVAIEKSSYGYYSGLVDKHGSIVDSMTFPYDEDSLSYVLVDQKRQRERMRHAEFDESKWKIWFEVFNDAGDLIGAGVLPDEFRRQSEAVERVGQLDQERRLLHEFSLLDENGKVVSEGKTFGSMFEATEALKTIYPDGLPSGWHLRDDTIEMQARVLDAIKKCRPSFKRSMICLDPADIKISRSDFYCAAPFSYCDKKYVYCEHLGDCWVEELKPKLNDAIAEAAGSSQDDAKKQGKRLEVVL